MLCAISLTLQNGAHQKMGNIFIDDNFHKCRLTFVKVIIYEYIAHLLMVTVFLERHGKCVASKSINFAMCPILDTPKKRCPSKDGLYIHR